MLALRANRPVSRSDLVDALWGEDLPPTAENSVHTYVKRLRQVLEPTRAPRASSQILTSTVAGYVLQVSSHRLDAHLLDEHVSRARELRAADDAARMVTSLDAALKLYGGTPLSGIPGPFAEIERARLSELRCDLIEERGQAMLHLGHHAEIALEMPGLVNEYPLRESLRGLHMLALYRCGRRGEALAAFRDTRRVLIDELGVEPGHELKRLHEQILSGDEVLEPDTMDMVAKPARARRITWVTPHQTPHDVAGFVGRENELAQLRSLLPAEGAAQAMRGMAIVTISGSAGIGKTAFAVHFGNLVADHFPDGQLYIDLRGFDARRMPVRSRQALGHLLRALGADPRQLPCDLDGQTSMYRSMLSGKRMLVILDNAANAQQVHPLLPGSTSCFVVITSRNRLRSLAARAGARPMALDVLTPAEAAALLAWTIGGDRVTAEAAAAAKLAALCGHLPLAVRIAAERVSTRPHLGLAELCGMLAIEQDRLDVLAADEESAAIRAVFDWSYRALSPAEARMFGLLGLHTGCDISIPAAAALAGSDPVSTHILLEGLANAHLLEEVSLDRYRFHDLLRV